MWHFSVSGDRQAPGAKRAPDTFLICAQKVPAKKLASFLVPVYIKKSPNATRVRTLFFCQNKDVFFRNSTFLCESFIWIFYSNTHGTFIRHHFRDV